MIRDKILTRKIEIIVLTNARVNEDTECQSFGK